MLSTNRDEIDSHLLEIPGQIFLFRSWERQHIYHFLKKLVIWLYDLPLTAPNDDKLNRFFVFLHGNSGMGKSVLLRKFWEILRTPRYPSLRVSSIIHWRSVVADNQDIFPNIRERHIDQLKYLRLLQQQLASSLKKPENAFPNFTAKQQQPQKWFTGPIRPQELATALGEDLKSLASVTRLLIFFDEYECVDECDALLRTVIRSAGSRVGWIIAGQHNLWNPLLRSAKPYKEFVRPEHSFVIHCNDRALFTAEDIKDYFTRVYNCILRNYSGIGMPNFKHIAETLFKMSYTSLPTEGLPRYISPLLAKLAAERYTQQTRTPHFLTLDAQHSIISDMVQHYLPVTENQVEYTRIYGLALLRRVTSHAITAALTLDDPQTFRSAVYYLSIRYSFIDSDTHDKLPALQREICHFVRLWLRVRRTQPDIQEINNQLLAAHIQALETLEKQTSFPTFQSRLKDQEWWELYLDLAQQLCWNDPHAGIKALVALMIAASTEDSYLKPSISTIGEFFLPLVDQQTSLYWHHAIEGLMPDNKANGTIMHSLHELYTYLQANNRVLVLPHPLSSIPTAELNALFCWKYALALHESGDIESIKNAITMYEYAMSILKSTTQLQNELVACYCQIAKMCYEQKEIHQCLIYCEKARTILLSLPLQEQDATQKQLIAELYYHIALLTDPPRTDYLEYVIALNADDWKAYAQRGQIRFKQKLYPKAIDDYNQALVLYQKSREGFTLQPQSPITYDADLAQLHVNLAEAYAAQQNYTQAIEHYTHAEQFVAPDERDLMYTILINKGITHQNQAQYPQAIQLFERANTFKPAAAKGYEQLGWLYLKRDQQSSDEALKMFHQCLALDPTHMQAAWLIFWLSLGESYPKKDDAAQLTEICRISPPNAYLVLVCQAIQTALDGNTQSGLKILTRAIENDSTRWDAYFWRGLMHAHKELSLSSSQYEERAKDAKNNINTALAFGMPPVLLRPLYYCRQHIPTFFSEYAGPLLEKHFGSST